MTNAELYRFLNFHLRPTHRANTHAVQCEHWWRLRYYVLKVIVNVWRVLWTMELAIGLILRSDAATLDSERGLSHVELRLKLIILRIFAIR